VRRGVGLIGEDGIEEVHGGRAGGGKGLFLEKLADGNDLRGIDLL
jgi:hypothetical protein